MTVEISLYFTNMFTFQYCPVQVHYSCCYAAEASSATTVHILTAVLEGTTLFMKYLLWYVASTPTANILLLPHQIFLSDCAIYVENILQ